MEALTNPLKFTQSILIIMPLIEICLGGLSPSDIRANLSSTEA